MAKPHKVRSYQKKTDKSVYQPNERAFDKGDDFHDKQGFNRRSFSGAERLTKEIRFISKPFLAKRGFAGLDIVESWDDIVGEDMAPGIRPEKLVFEKDARTNGTLHVKSAGGAFAVIFEHKKMQIIERINTFFGYPAIARIHIIQGKLNFVQPETGTPVKKIKPSELKNLENRVNQIEDEELRAKMYEIGLKLLQNRK